MRLLITCVVVCTVAACSDVAPKQTAGLDLRVDPARYGGCLHPTVGTPMRADTYDCNTITPAARPKPDSRLEAHGGIRIGTTAEDFGKGPPEMQPL